MPRRDNHFELRQLNKQLFQLVLSFPRASSELVDFHYKSNVENYLTAIEETNCRRTLILAQNSADARVSLRKSLILSDLVVFNCRNYLGPPGLGFFPISDEMRSPVLGMMAVIDPESATPRPPRPVELAYHTALVRAQEPSERIRLLSASWNGDSAGWERSNFTRTSEPYTNDLGEECHIAGGPIHVQIPQDDTLLDELRILLENGRVAFAPFISVGSDTIGIDESILKADLVSADLTAQVPVIRTEQGSVHPLASLKIPYLEGIPLDLLGRVLEDEEESLRSFRRAVDRSLEDIKTSPDPNYASRELIRLKRDLIEDELDKVRQVCERVSRMNTIARIGGFVALGGFSIAAVMGLDPPSVVCGATGVAAATVAELYRNLEDKRSIRRSPMYFVWQLERLTS